jgi:hypothetical protein
MVSEKKLIANRNNAQKSTGPRTKEGKEKSSQNARTHGLFCHALLLPHEDKIIFAGFRDSYLLALKPQNLPELQLVDQIVSCVWRLRRIQEAEHFLYSNHKNDFIQQRRISKDADQEIISAAACAQAYTDDTTEPKLTRLAQHEQRHQRTLHRCYKELRQLRKDKIEDLPTCPYYDHPEQVFHLNPLDIPEDESTWPDFTSQEDDDVNDDTDIESDQNEPTPVSKQSEDPDPSSPITNNQSPITNDQNEATSPASPIENRKPVLSEVEGSKIKNPTASLRHSLCTPTPTGPASTVTQVTLSRSP